MTSLALDPSSRRRVLALWAVWSAGVLLLAGAAMSVPVSTSNPWIEVMHAPPLARWDAVWYRSVAVEGFRYDPQTKENNVGFYPLYPLLMRWTSRLLHTPILWTGIGISLACLLPALLLAGDLFAQWSGPDSALPAIAALLLFPTAFYFASVYTESLFLLTTVAAFWCARRNWWVAAGIAGSCACLTRFNGFLIGLPLLWYGARAVRSARISWIRPAGALAVTAAGALAFPAYLAARWGDPLLYVHSKAAGWNVGATPLWTFARRLALEVRDHARDPGRLDTLSFVSQLGSAILLLVLTAALFRRRMVAEGLYAAVTLLLLFHSGAIVGFDRYALSLFPCFLVLAEFLRPRRIAAFAGALVGPALQASFLHRFVHWIMVS